jgi:hypothetical protein
MPTCGAKRQQARRRRSAARGASPCLAGRIPGAGWWQGRVARAAAGAGGAAPRAPWRPGSCARWSPSWRCPATCPRCLRRRMQGGSGPPLAGRLAAAAAARAGPRSRARHAPPARSPGAPGRRRGGKRQQRGGRRGSRRGRRTCRRREEQQGAVPALRPAHRHEVQAQVAAAAAERAQPQHEPAAAARLPPFACGPGARVGAPGRRCAAGGRRLGPGAAAAQALARCCAAAPLCPTPGPEARVLLHLVVDGARKDPKVAAQVAGGAHRGDLRLAEVQPLLEQRRVDREGVGQAGACLRGQGREGGGQEGGGQGGGGQGGASGSAVLGGRGGDAEGAAAGLGATRVGCHRDCSETAARLQLELDRARSSTVFQTRLPV